MSVENALQYGICKAIVLHQPSFQQLSGCNYVTKTRDKALPCGKKYCAQWQRKGSRCLTHNLCAIFIGFNQRDNCAVAIVNIIKASVPSCSRFWVHCTTDHSFCHTDVEDNGDNQELIYGRDVTASSHDDIIVKTAGNEPKRKQDLIS